jgi:hypothetical protein
MITQTIFHYYSLLLLLLSLQTIFIAAASVLVVQMPFVLFLLLLVLASFGYCSSQSSLFCFVAATSSTNLFRFVVVQSI